MRGPSSGRLSSRLFVPLLLALAAVAVICGSTMDLFGGDVEVVRQSVQDDASVGEDAFVEMQGVGAAGAAKSGHRRKSTSANFWLHKAYKANKLRHQMKKSRIKVAHASAERTHKLLKHVSLSAANQQHIANHRARKSFRHSAARKTQQVVTAAINRLAQKAQERLAKAAAKKAQEVVRKQRRPSKDSLALRKAKEQERKMAAAVVTLKHKLDTVMLAASAQLSSSERKQKTTVEDAADRLARAKRTATRFSKALNKAYAKLKAINGHYKARMHNLAVMIVRLKHKLRLSVSKESAHKATAHLKKRIRRARASEHKAKTGMREKRSKENKVKDAFSNWKKKAHSRAEANEVEAKLSTKQQVAALRMAEESKISSLRARRSRMERRYKWLVAKSKKMHKSVEAAMKRQRAASARADAKNLRRLRNLSNQYKKSERKDKELSAKVRTMKGDHARATKYSIRAESLMKALKSLKTHFALISKRWGMHFKTAARKAKESRAKMQAKLDKELKKSKERNTKIRKSERVQKRLQHDVAAYRTKSHEAYVKAEHSADRFRRSYGNRWRMKLARQQKLYKLMELKAKRIAASKAKAQTSAKERAAKRAAWNKKKLARLRAAMKHALELAHKNLRRFNERRRKLHAKKGFGKLASERARKLDIADNKALVLRSRYRNMKAAEAHAKAKAAQRYASAVAAARRKIDHARRSERKAKKAAAAMRKRQNEAKQKAAEAVHKNVSVQRHAASNELRAKGRLAHFRNGAQADHVKEAAAKARSVALRRKSERFQKEAAAARHGAARMEGKAAEQAHKRVAQARRDVRAMRAKLHQLQIAKERAEKRGLKVVAMKRVISTLRSEVSKAQREVTRAHARGFVAGQSAGAKAREKARKERLRRAKRAARESEKKSLVRRARLNAAREKIRKAMSKAQEANLKKVHSALSNGRRVERLQKKSDEAKYKKLGHSGERALKKAQQRERQTKAKKRKVRVVTHTRTVPVYKTRTRVVRKVMTKEERVPKKVRRAIRRVYHKYQKLKKEEYMNHEGDEDDDDDDEDDEDDKRLKKVMKRKKPKKHKKRAPRKHRKSPKAKKHSRRAPTVPLRRIVKAEHIKAKKKHKRPRRHKKKSRRARRKAKRHTRRKAKKHARRKAKKHARHARKAAKNVPIKKVLRKAFKRLAHQDRKKAHRRHTRKRRRHTRKRRRHTRKRRRHTRKRRRHTRKRRRHTRKRRHRRKPRSHKAKRHVRRAPIVHLPRSVVRQARRVVGHSHKKKKKKLRKVFDMPMHPLPRAHAIIRDASKLYRAAMERRAKARRRLHRAILVATETGMPGDKKKVSEARMQLKKAVQDAMYDKAGLIAVTKHALARPVTQKVDLTKPAGVVHDEAHHAGVFDGIEW